MEFRTPDTKKKKFNVFDLFRDIEKLYGVLYMLLLVFIIYLGTRYVHTLDYNKLYSAPLLLSADTNMRVDQPVKRGAITPPVDIIKYSTPSPELIAHGKELYDQNCASCHGATGAGDGTAGATLNPPPRNFVDPSKQVWKHGPKVSQMYITLQEGIPNTGMASFNIIPPEDRFAIIQYVQTFNPTYPKDNPEEVASLDQKYQLSQGGKLPNQIPLKLAMELQTLNYDTLKADLNAISWSVDNDKSDTGAVIFSQLVSNKTKALNALASSMIWTTSPEDFIKFLQTDPVDKGFKASLYQESNERMNMVYQYLKNVFAKNRV